MSTAGTKHDHEIEQLIHQRDHAQDMADKLAHAIATKLKVDVGEHSNVNCPWENALEIIEGREFVALTKHEIEVV